MRSVDQIDLPWLLGLISELRVEPSAVVTLTDAVRGNELVIMIDQDRYHVERSADGGRSRLAADQGPERSDGPAVAQDGSVDLGAARLALCSVIMETPLDPGLRWTRVEA